MLNIGILFISTGIYNQFWNGFYESVQKYFCPNSKKKYYVFTDNLSFKNSEYPDDVSVHYIEDKGWVANVLRRSDLFVSIRDELLHNDYIFNLNSNFRPITFIQESEVIATSENDWLSALCFDFYSYRNSNTFAYERNSESKAYVPYGIGKYYFQGSFYGGRASDFLEMSQWIKQQTDDDTLKFIIPICHDESYLNRYLIDRNPLVLGTKYAKAEQWPMIENEEVKGMLLDKNKVFKTNDIFNLKAFYSEPSLCCLVDNKYCAHPIGIVNLKGGLGNQMFQYALFLKLVDKFKNRKFYLNAETLNYYECHQGYQLDYIFNVASDKLLNKNISDSISLVPKHFKRFILEKDMNVCQDFEDSTHPIWVIDGYWQNEKYFNNNIRECFRFDFLKLNDYNKRMLSNITTAENSIGIHVRRGDYKSSIKVYELMGEICTRKYYIQAINQFDSNSTFFVFSDDIDWCRENIKCSNVIYVTQKTPEDDWQDMVLMSSCKHLIISNSSFSWWSAWLNDYINKKIIAPAKWYNKIDNRVIVPQNWFRISPPNESSKYSNLTIVIPIRVDSKERKRNLSIVLKHLLQLSGLKIIILEADLKSKIDLLPDEVGRVFIEDSNLVFHRTKYINILSMLVDTKYLGVWDADVIVPIENIKQALDMLTTNQADMVYPYDGRFYNIPDDILDDYIKCGDEKIFVMDERMKSTSFIKHSCGGAFMVNKQSYIDAGGENEKFTGWGPEDLERFKRWEILGYCVARLDGGIYHMSHPRNENSRYFDRKSKNRMLKALLETCNGNSSKIKLS